MTWQVVDTTGEGMTLDVLGITDAQLRVYQELLGRSSADAAELAVRTGVARHAIQEQLDRLEALGLVARSGARYDRYVAAPPDVALASLLLDHEERTRRARTELSRLEAVYREAAPRQTEDAVDVVRGSEAVRQRFNQLQRSARAEVLEFVRGDVAVVEPSQNVEEEAALARGVAYRFVIERPAVEREGVIEAVRSTVERGAQVRLVRSLPTRLLVVDRRIAMVPFSASSRDQSGGALLLQAGGLLDMATALFEQTWRSASPLGEDDDEPSPAVARDADLEPADRYLLQLLNAGLTDRTVAARLGVSMRTVQRQVRTLMERADVDTRLQLGVVAARQGWL
ncbi:helix-turn-helix domain-containing protein [Isoptericola sp. AK164]|uniref:helix-turn-helix domain-containing protein n=1 Tax=Isoptericola sp. AK164 TaxID=3024246 RepID=UPI0024181DBA|nr:helix-turn-helix domain-containing protein [Isoptericola sp. AK164]